jgi:hypothetical protein
MTALEGGPFQQIWRQATLSSVAGGELSSSVTLALARLLWTPPIFVRLTLHLPSPRVSSFSSYACKNGLSDSVRSKTPRPEKRLQCPLSPQPTA